MLGHRFNSEVILLAVDMPEFLDAPMMEPSGRAVWYSFGTLMPESTDGRREESGRGVRELQGK